MSEKLVLAFTGGTDSVIATDWYNRKGYKVTAFMVNVGQGEDFNAINQKALKSGASKTIIADTVVDDLIQAQFAILRAGAICENGYKLGGAFTKPFIAKKHAEIALAEGGTIAHGAHPGQNDYYRFNTNYQLFAPGVEVLTPWTDPEFINQFKHREDMIEYALKNNLPIEATLDKPFTTEPGLFLVACLTKVAGDQRDESKAPAKDMYIMCLPPDMAPEEPALIDIEFQSGNPVKVIDKISGYSSDVPIGLITYLNTVGAIQGVGRLLTEGINEAGKKYWGYYEEPGQSLLYFAHEKLEDAVYGLVTGEFRKYMPEYTALVYKGDWFTGRRPQLQEIIDKYQQNVTGSVRLSLGKGTISLAGINI